MSVRDAQPQPHCRECNGTGWIPDSLSDGEISCPECTNWDEFFDDGDTGEDTNVEDSYAR